MKNLENLEKQLLEAEFMEARTVYSAARSAGHGPVKAAALVYRAGRLAGREELQGKLKEAYKGLNALRTRLATVEAALSEPDKQMLAIVDLINNPAPNRDLDEMIQQSLNSGDNMEARTNE